MFTASLIKEFKLVFRDIHSVLVLFVMPAVFITIMSLAMQEQFSDKSDFKLKIKFFDRVKNDFSEKTLGFLREIKHFQLQDATELQHTALPSPSEKLQTTLDPQDKAYFYFLPDNEDVFADEGSSQKVEVQFSPSVDAHTRQLILSALKEAVAKTKLLYFLQAQGLDADAMANSISNNPIVVSYLYQAAEQPQTPTAVQQSVPAWLIFSMFFVVIPISTTLITEKQQGTLTRLRTMNIAMGGFLFAKILPYLVINQLQLVIMLLLGAYGIPLLNGERLIIGDAYGGLLLISLATGFSAVGYALLIAVIAKTTEQATSIGGVGNILLGALGGIMVPKFIMPGYLQTLTQISPMSWALEGFLDLFLRGGNAGDLLAEAGMLAAFGLLMLTLAWGIFHRQR